MKKHITLFLTFAFIVFLADAQNIKIKEPEFIGNVVFVNDSIGDGLPLEFQQGNLKMKSNGVSFIPGANLIAGKTSMKYYVNGISSPVVLLKKENLYFIVRASSNDFDPIATIKIFKMTITKKSRTIEVVSMSSMGRQNDPTITLVTFKGKKYGVNSYIIEISTIEPGEYAISTIEGNFYMFAIK